MWLCTNWQVDWAAISTVVASAAALVALMGYWLRRNARVRLLTQLIVADLAFLHLHLNRKESLVGLDVEEELQGYLDAMVSLNEQSRSEVVSLPSSLPALRMLREHSSELDVLPVKFSDSLARVLFEFSLLEAVAEDLDSLGSGDQPGAIDKMKDLRKGFKALQGAVDAAQGHGKEILESRWRKTVAKWPF